MPRRGVDAGVVAVVAATAQVAAGERPVLQAETGT